MTETYRLPTCPANPRQWEEGDWLFTETVVMATFLAEDATDTVRGTVVRTFAGWVAFDLMGASLGDPQASAEDAARFLL